MACFKPLTAWKTESGEVVWSERGAISRELTLPCGQCVGCRLERSRQWAVRVMHESQMHLGNSFVTLTYDDDHVPSDGSLNYRHYQLFMKRLRKKIGPVRFYMAGEYGEKFGRPHYHACLFGAYFGDRQLFKRMGSGCDIYTSELLSSVWTDGFASVGELTFESAAYVARYCMKKVTGDKADEHYRRTDFITGESYSIEPEFNRMSLRPGIGASWLDKYKTDVYPHDHVISNGFPAKPPRYFDQRLAVIDPDTSEFMELVRYRKKMASCSLDQSRDRLEVREKVARARLNFKQRNLG